MMFKTRFPVRMIALTFVLLSCAPEVATSAEKGKLLQVQVHGKSLEKTVTRESANRTVAVYLPPSYDDSQDRRYPVVYLLHGIGGTHRDWVGSGRAGNPWATIQDVMDREIAAGLVEEMIVVAPDQMTRGGGSFYVNSAVTGNWEDFTRKDLVAFVDGKYRTLAQASSRGITGHSMGGYGAILLGMKHPDVYQVVYGLNSALLGWAGDVTEEQPAYHRAAKATPQSLNPRQDFYTPSLICVAQAFSPNPDRPPFFMDLPFVPHEGELRKDEAVYDRWTKKMPLYLVEKYKKNLLSLRALRFDSGRYDQYTHIVPTNRWLSEKLNELGIPHTFEEYNGDHRNRLWGRNGRMATEVMPYFSRNLVFDKEPAPR